MSECSVIQLVPGPVGPSGADGSDGTDGVNAYTVTTASFVMPAAAADVTVAVEDSDWMATGQAVYVSNAGYFTVQSIISTTSVSLRNLGYTGNTAAAATVVTAQKVATAGIQGTASSFSGTAAGGDLTGTYLNPTIDLLKVTSGKMSVSGATAGTYGSATNVPQLTVDVAGRITAIANVAGTFSGAPTGTAGPTILSGTFPNPGIQAGVLTSTMMSATGIAGAYGSTTAIPVLTFDAAGRCTAASTAALTFTGTYPTATYQNVVATATPIGLGAAYATMTSMTYTAPSAGVYLLIANLQLTFASASKNVLFRFADTTLVTELANSEKSFTNDIAITTTLVLSVAAVLTAGQAIGVQGKNISGGTVQLVDDSTFTVVKLS